MAFTRPVLALGLEAPMALRGGLNVIVETLIEGLAPTYRIVLISTDAQGELPDYLRSAVYGHLTWPFPKTSIRNASRLAHAAKEMGVQLAHFHDTALGWGMRFFGHSPVRHLARLGIKVFWTNHMWVSVFEGLCAAQKPLWFKLALLPIAWSSRLLELGPMEMVLTSSQLTLEKERQFYWPRRDKFRRMYYSRLLEGALPSEAPRSNTIVAVGHVAWRKGQLTLARAFARIAPYHLDWRLIIIGPVNEVEYGQAIEVTLNQPALTGRFELLGGRNDALDYIKSAGIFVQPSVFEGLPFALQEAMFFGAPCVATRCFGNIELVEHEKTGLMVEPGDDVAMADALDRLIRDSALRERLAKAGRPFVLKQGMTFERMIANHCALYEAALSK